MKRIIPHLFLIIVTALPLCTTAQYFKKGTISAAAGFSAFTAGGNDITKAPVTKPGTMHDYKSTTFSPYFLMVNYGLTNGISIGGCIGKMAARSVIGTGTDSLSNVYDSRTYEYAFTGTYTLIAGRADWHWLRSDDSETYSMDFYSGVSLGIYRVKTAMYFKYNPTSVSEANTHRTLDIPKIGPVWHVNIIGYKQMFGSKGRFGSVVELGWGYWGAIRIGLLYNIRR